MRKILTFILKIVMILAFVGIVAFGAVAIINNSYEISSAHATISSSQESKPYTEFYSLLKNNLRTSVNGTEDEYAVFLNGTMADLNSAIDYYTDYLVLNKDLSKDEQIELKDYYSKYSSAFETTKRTYNAHIEWYVDRVNDHEVGDVHHWNDIEKLKYITNNQSIVDSYVACYKAGSNFFWRLYSTVKNDVLKGRLNYYSLSYALRVSYADKAVSGVFASTKVSPSTNTDAQKYLDIRDKFDKFDESSQLTDSSVNTFVYDLNQIDVRRLVNDYDNYYENAGSELKVSISRSKEFLNSKY